MKTFNQLLKEFEVPVDVGDTILTGKWKNKRTKVKKIETNEKGDVLINGKPAMKFRIVPQEEEPIENI